MCITMELTRLLGSMSRSGRLSTVRFMTNEEMTNEIDETEVEATEVEEESD